jgi:Tfp pilus assembly protein PilF
MTSSQVKLSSEATQHKNLIPILICLALAILTVIAFWSLKGCGFINFDDDHYVYENAYVQSGLNANSIGQAFSFSSELVKKSTHWHPVTWLSLMLDYQIFGLNPSGFHLINLLFHVMNTILLFLILRRMTKTLWPSAFVAALFAIHPLHVESVAWITERKDVLSTFFWMLTMGAYSYYVEHPGFRRYFFVLLFFVLGLMSKPMLVTLPFVLLLLDYWPLQRFGEITGMNPKASFGNRFRSKLRCIKPSAARDCSTDPIPLRFAFGIGVSTIKPDHKIQKETLEVKKPADPEYKWSLIYPLLWEKVPLFILAILSSIITYIAAQSSGYVHSLEVTPTSVRIGNAFISYIAYIGKTIWPSNLAVLYPYPELLVPWQVFGSVLLLIFITLAVFWMVKRSPYLATGWLWYMGTLVPVIGIVQVASQSMADRFTYIPLIGLFIMVAWGVPDLLKKWKYRKEILLASSALSILCLSIITWTQVGYWQNNITLFDHTLKVTDYNWHIYLNRGVAYGRLGNYSQAIDDCSRAIKIQPGYVEAYTVRGIAYSVLGNYKQAIKDYSEAIRLKADSDINYYDRGTLYAKDGQYQLAIEDFNQALRLNPNYTKTYNNRGIVYTQMGIYQKALEDFNEAIHLKSDYADAYNNRASIYLKQGDNISGCRDAQKACELGNCKLLEAANTSGLCR